MTCSNLSSEQSIEQARNKTYKAKRHSSFLLYTLRSYWWIAVICSIVYGFAGPVFTMLKLESAANVTRYGVFSTEEVFLQQQANEMASWFRAEGFMMLYVSAIILAAVIGCIMFFYLQQKKQVNFYHSQPITRTRLFLNQYVVGLLLNIIPLLVMIAISFLLVAVYHLGSILNLGTIITHTLYICLFLIASYSIAVFAGQLAGTVMTQISLNAVLHFAAPVAVGVLHLMCSLFYATYSGPYSSWYASLKFSPICAAVQYLDSIPYQRAMTMTTAPMDGSIIAVQLGLAIVLSVLAWLLYQKRPSEAVGKAMVYPITEPILKTYLMAVISLLCGVLFSEFGGSMFFYFAVISFAILTHMTCEVILQHDFKAMGRKMPQCAVILVLILTVVGIFRFDLLHYDSYLPEPKHVMQVSLVVSNADASGEMDAHSYYSQDAAVKQSIHDLLQVVIDQKQYKRSNFFKDARTNMEYGDTTSVIVYYQRANGRIQHRIYRGVPAESITEQYQALYDQRAYREAIYSDILTLSPEQVMQLTVGNNAVYTRQNYEEMRMIETVDMAVDGEIAVTTIPAAAEDLKPQRDNGTPNTYQKMEAILQAFKQDLVERQFTTLTKPRQCRLELQLSTRDHAYGYRYLVFSVYEDDWRTMALLDQFDISSDEREYDTLQDAWIFRCEPSSEAELRRMLEQAYQELQDTTPEPSDAQFIQQFSRYGELTAHIQEQEQVAQFCRESNLLNGAGCFAAMDTTHFVLLGTDKGYGGGISMQLLYQDTLPEQYR